MFPHCCCVAVKPACKPSVYKDTQEELTQCINIMLDLVCVCCKLQANCELVIGLNSSDQLKCFSVLQSATITPLQMVSMWLQELHKALEQFVRRL